MLQIDKIYNELKEKISTDKIILNASMKDYTSFKIGGKADLLVTVENIEEVKYVLEISNKYTCPIFILGNGTNILVKDNGIRGIVLRIRLDRIQILENDEENIEVIVEAGVKNSILAQKLLKQELSGFEFAAGIPGTIGGAINMNAGAYGGEIKDILVETTYLDYQGNIYTISNKENKFSYRNSIFREIKAIILSARFRFIKSKADIIKEKMKQNEISRKEKQPLEFPNAGSTFKRGEDFVTAKLIDECNLKGYKIGDAQISEKHAGFVVNTGNATAQDVMNLINKVKEEVYSKFNKNIELEIEVIGE